MMHQEDFEGFLVFGDILAWFPDYRFEVIFDVGANHGQSCKKYAKLFPSAKIHAFEPIESTFVLLKELTAPFKGIAPWQIALSSKSGFAQMTNEPGATGNRISDKGQETVATERGDEFCLDLDIRHISFLKIDAEGHDLEVLRGFGDMLDRVDFVQVEVACNRHVKQCLPLRSFEDFLAERGFYVFAHYDQVWEFKEGPTRPCTIKARGRVQSCMNALPILRRMDSVFINPRLVSFPK